MPNSLDPMNDKTYDYMRDKRYDYVRDDEKRSLYGITQGGLSAFTSLVLA